MGLKARFFISILVVFLISYACNEKDNSTQKNTQYAIVDINPNLDDLNENQKKVINYLIKAAKQADDIFWKQTYGEKNNLLYQLRNESQEIKNLVLLNYGPWDRFNENKPLIDDYSSKPKGSNLYPPNFTREDFLTIADTNKYCPYTVIREDSEHNYTVIKYYNEYATNLKQAIGYIQKAEKICINPSFKYYLNQLISDLKKDEYTNSFSAWLKINNYPINFLFGPHERFSNEDDLMNIKSVYGSILLRPIEKWEPKTDSIFKAITYLHSCLPINKEVRTEIPSTNGNEVGVYDIIACSGKWNAGAKEISMFMPQDPLFHLKYGSKKLFFNNAAHAKYNFILMPIGNNLITENQRKHISYISFVENILFGDISNGLDIKKTINNESVQQQLKESFAVIKIASSQISSQYLASKYNEYSGKDDETTMNNYVTFLSNIIRTIRFGITNSYSRANTVIFNMLINKGAIEYNPDKREYSVNYEKMKQQSFEITEDLLRIQSEGNYEEAKKLIAEMGYIKDETIIDLYFLSNKNIPKDISYNQKLFN